MSWLGQASLALDFALILSYGKVTRPIGLRSGVISVSSTGCITEILRPLIMLFSVTRFLYGFNLGISAASLCINRRLYLIVSVRKVTISRTEKCREIVIDLAIGLGIPIISIILCKHFETEQLNEASNLF